MAGVEGDPGDPQALDEGVRPGRAFGGGRGVVAHEEPRGGRLRRIGRAGEGVREGESRAGIVEGTGKDRGAPGGGEGSRLVCRKADGGNGLERQGRGVGDVGQGDGSLGPESFGGAETGAGRGLLEEGLELLQRLSAPGGRRRGEWPWHGLDVRNDAVGFLKARPGKLPAKAGAGKGGAFDLEGDSADRALGGLVEPDADSLLLEPLDERREPGTTLRALLDGGAKRRLEVLLAFAQDAVDLVLAKSRRVAGRRRRELVELLDLAAQPHPALAVVGVGDELAAVGHPGGDDVDVVMLAVGVAVDHEGDVRVAQAVEVVGGGAEPAGVVEAFARGEAQRGVEDGLRGAFMGEVSHVGSDFARGSLGRVATPEEVSLGGIGDVVEDAAETGTLAETVDHGQRGRGGRRRALTERRRSERVRSRERMPG
jgi:hypothetical protein